MLTNPATLIITFAADTATQTQELVEQSTTSWKPSENLCMLSAMFGLMNKEQQKLATVRSVTVFISAI